MKKLKKILSIFLRTGISVAALIFLFKFNKIDIYKLIETIKAADKYLLFSAFFIFLFSYILCFYRWEMLLRTLRIHLPLKRIVISFSGGIFFSLLLPSTIGGDLIRSIDLATHTQRPKEVVATVLLDRLSGYIGLTILALLGVTFGWKYIVDKSILVYVGFITVVLIVILLIIFNRYIYFKINRLLHSPNAGKMREMIKNLHQEIHLFRHHKIVITNNLFFSLLAQAISPITCFIIALSLGLKLNIIYFFIFLPIIGAVSLLPISIGGLGIRENMTVIFFKSVGMNENLAIAMSLLNFFFILLYAGIGGLIYVLTVHHRRIQHHKPPTLSPTHH